MIKRKFREQKGKKETKIYKEIYKLQECEENWILDEEITGYN